MLIDLLSTSNYVSYNVNIANLLGLKMAVYLSELMNINNKAIHKRKTNSKYGFILDRDYITIRTTLTKEEQLDLDKTLVEFGVLELEDSYLNLDINKLASILMSDSKELVQDVKRLVKKQPKPTKRQSIADGLKGNIVTTNGELIEAYSEWIDAVMAKSGWMSKKAVVEGQRVVDSISNHNLDVALKIVSIATVNGYRDMTWAVDVYKRQFSLKIEEEPKPIKKGLSDDIF